MKKTIVNMISTNSPEQLPLVITTWSIWMNPLGDPIRASNKIYDKNQYNYYMKLICLMLPHMELFFLLVTIYGAVLFTRYHIWCCSFHMLPSKMLFFSLVTKYDAVTFTCYHIWCYSFYLLPYIWCCSFHLLPYMVLHGSIFTGSICLAFLYTHM